MSRWSSVRIADRLAVLNGFGISIGDSIVGLQALHAGQTLGLLPGDVTLFRRTDCRAMVQAVYAPAGFARTAVLEERCGAGFDAVIDIRDFAFDADFRGVAMIDFFLRRLGIDPGSVPPGLKRNTWLAPRIRLPASRAADGAYVLVCPSSSMPLRDMPADVHAAVVRVASGFGPARVLTQGAACDGGVHVPECTDFTDLCALVAGARCVVSTDTAMVHLADAFDVACLAVFTTHRPEWRVRDYPLCTAVHLPVPGLPEALEFSRGDGDLADARANWTRGQPAILQAVETFLASVQ